MPRKQSCFVDVKWRVRVEKVGAGCGGYSMETWGGRRLKLDGFIMLISKCRETQQLR